MPLHGYKGEFETKCPYYICEGDANIVCEGYEGKTKSVKSFKSVQEKADHQQSYCFDPNHYRDCSQCILIDAKYKLIEEGLRKDAADDAQPSNGTL